MACWCLLRLSAQETGYIIPDVAPPAALPPQAQNVQAVPTPAGSNPATAVQPQVEGEALPFIVSEQPIPGIPILGANGVETMPGAYTAGSQPNFPQQYPAYPQELNSYPVIPVPYQYSDGIAYDGALELPPGAVLISQSVVSESGPTPEGGSSMSSPSDIVVAGESVSGSPTLADDASGPLTAELDKARNTIAKLRDQLANSKREIQALTQRVYAAEKKASSSQVACEKRVKSLESMNAKLTSDLASFKKSIDEAAKKQAANKKLDGRTKVAKLTKESKALKENLSELEGLVKQNETQKAQLQQTVEKMKRELESVKKSENEKSRGSKKINELAGEKIQDGIGCCQGPTSTIARKT